MAHLSWSELGINRQIGAHQCLDGLEVRVSRSLECVAKAAGPDIAELALRERHSALEVTGVSGIDHEPRLAALEYHELVPVGVVEHRDDDRKCVAELQLLMLDDYLRELLLRRMKPVGRFDIKVNPAHVASMWLWWAE